MAVEYEARRAGEDHGTHGGTPDGAPHKSATGRAGGNRWLGVLRSPLGWCAAALLLLVLLLAVFGPLLWSGRADAIDTGRLLEGPSGRHWMGTDNLGRDVLFRVLVATRLSVALALLATVLGVVTGLLLGVAPLLLGRRVGRLVTAVVNVAVAFPGLLLALFFAVVFGLGAKGAVLAIGFAMAPGFARLTQTLVASVSERDFVHAARVAGVGDLRVLTRHVLPNISDPLIVNATISAGGALLAFSGLSFLGLGVQPPSYDWGRLLGEGLNGIYTHPAAALAPGAAVVIAGLAFNLTGEAVAKAVGVPTAHRSRAVRPVRPAGPSEAGSAPAVAPDTDGPGREPVLSVEGLRVSFPGPDGPVSAVRGVGFSVGQGEAVGVVGESGSGKSLTALAVSRLVEHPGTVDAHRLEFLGTSLLDGKEQSAATRRLLGTSLAMVFQDPMTSFNPTMRIGRQLAEVAQQHLRAGRREALSRAVERLREVRMPAAERRAAQYPHEFSGGMRQRAMIALGLMGHPRLIIADEPTTALDVTVQRQVLRLLERIRAADDVALLLISHDINVVAQTCDRVLVMYAGRIVEELPSDRLLTAARHPYTRALIATVPHMDTDLDRPLAVIPGRPVTPDQVPAGCAFAARCAFARDRCRTDDPRLEASGPGHRVACWYPHTETADRPLDERPADLIGEKGERP
ncbi:peptide/nickel transport system permease protein [Streptomyces aurantiacus]|uniref:dipeptide/oligopeptide/nickel ABC transporter permease/ATP-binding protein n=1 Tax=Streptomyces aurantiacus TaxID=47760 RepID=UPI00278DF44D|nr:dipeptide/oligopeptide/nickel ABC transporter permease/ATP-binding protein [Streptomyces aurantiacus]MDQ0771919.1 peptide/nickel transport system permease protein [Streptomyces aurantiacus]